jgi:hypothetical protein
MNAGCCTIDDYFKSGTAAHKLLDEINDTIIFDALRQREVSRGHDRQRST